MPEYMQEIILGILGGMTLLQVVPIKIDPWSWIARQIGRAINGELMDKVDGLELRLEKMEAADEEREALNARLRILRFGDECQHDQLHSQEHFAQILDDIDHYEAYCMAHPDFKNNKAVLTIEKIKKTYAKRIQNNDFL